MWVEHDAVGQGQAELAHRRVATQVLVRQEQHLLPALERPAQRAFGIRRRANGAAMGTGKSFDGGRRVHVGDRDRDTRNTSVGQHVPGVEHLLVAGHVGHRAASGQVREYDGLARVGEDVSRFGHEMHATEDDVLGTGSRGRIPSKLERVTSHIGEGDHLVPLIVVTQYEHSVAEGILGGCSALDQPRIRRFGQRPRTVDTALGQRVATPPEQQQRMRRRLGFGKGHITNLRAPARP